MNVYTFCPSASPSWQASLMRSLDSYFDFSGIRERIVLIDSNGLTLAKEEHTEVSTIVKILKIISFIIFFPLVIVALSIRYLLHKKFDRKWLYLPTEITRKEELILAANSQLVTAAALSVTPLFYGFPKKYQIIKVEVVKEQVPKITFSINIDLILKDLNLQSIDWPTTHLYDDLDFTGHPEEKALIDKIRKIEGKDSKQMSLESKKLLAKHFLQYFCCNLPDPTIKSAPLLFYTYNKDKYGDYKTIWHEIYFVQTGSIFHKVSGALLYDRLLELGFALGRLTSMGAVLGTRFTIEWDNDTRVEFLQSIDFLPK
ncbi:Family of unknown function (DUF648) [Chlamydia serpentis]|uniref:Uncharacterized protein n=1 Tax=Chlamydia serpentis TaxID=1967782 RepID=A0A2R8FAI1_9CHLA|nr:DUF648 domain-containing protein [Chlamydia serpentis]SPN73316.1 Family of unknown function (DUF648) [Chlamydia serpentis]